MEDVRHVFVVLFTLWLHVSVNAWCKLALIRYKVGCQGQIHLCACMCLCAHGCHVRLFSVVRLGWRGWGIRGVRGERSAGSEDDSRWQEEGQWQVTRHLVNALPYLEPWELIFPLPPQHKLPLGARKGELIYLSLLVWYVQRGGLKTHKGMHNLHIAAYLFFIRVKSGYHCVPSRTTGTLSTTSQIRIRNSWFAKYKECKGICHNDNNAEKISPYDGHTWYNGRMKDTNGTMTTGRFPCSAQWWHDDNKQQKILRMHQYRYWSLISVQNQAEIGYL